MRPERAATVLAVAVVTTFVLAGCRSLPLPAVIDLRPALGEAASGAVEAPIRAGQASDLVLDLPDGGERCQDVDGAPAGVTVERAELTYEVTLAYDGPPLSGVATARPFVAATEAGVWRPESALGGGIEVDLSTTTAVVSDTVSLSAEQLTAVNGGRVCWGVRVEADVAAEESGTAVIEYDVEELRMRLGFSLF